MKPNRFIGTWVLPALPYTLWSNKNEIPDTPEGLDAAELLAEFNEELASITADQIIALTTVYEDSQTRFSTLEAKATGVLTAIAIVAATASIACTGPLAAAILGSIALLFLTSGGIACCWILLPRQRYALLLSDVLEPNLAAHLALCTRMSEHQTLRVSNLITSALNDLLRALAATLIAIILFVVFK